MITLKRTNSSDKDFIHLVTYLDADLKIRDGDDHDFYHQFNNIDTIRYCIVAYQNQKAVGCGAIKKYDSLTMEVKRMFVHLDFRGKGIASKILSELEHWAKELQIKRCVLETGVNQPEAIALYKKCDYSIISNYGQYVDVKNSICFEKFL